MDVDQYALTVNAHSVRFVWLKLNIIYKLY